MARPTVTDGSTRRTGVSDGKLRRAPLSLPWIFRARPRFNRFRSPAALIAVCLVAAGCSCAAIPPPKISYLTQGSYAYAAGTNQKIKVVQPGTANGRTVLSVVGGGYHGLNLDITPMLASELDISWRVLQLSYEPGTVNSVESQVDDALEFVAKNAQQ